MSNPVIAALDQEAERKRQWEKAQAEYERRMAERPASGEVVDAVAQIVRYATVAIEDRLYWDWTEGHELHLHLLAEPLPPGTRLDTRDGLFITIRWETVGPEWEITWGKATVNLEATVARLRAFREGISSYSFPLPAGWDHPVMQWEDRTSFMFTFPDWQRLSGEWQKLVRGIQAGMVDHLNTAQYSTVTVSEKSPSSPKEPWYFWGSGWGLPVIFSLATVVLLLLGHVL